MKSTRRPRRSPSQKIVKGRADTPALETARMRRERRTHRASVLPGGSTHSKGASRVKPASRARTLRAKSLGNQPPVYMRGGMAGLPVKPRKLGAPPKRRYNVALNVPGAELHLPALPVLRLSWRTVSGLLAALMLGLAIYLWTSPSYRVFMVEVTGLKRLTANDINTVAGLSGQPIFAVDPQQVRKDLQQAFPDMKNVAVKISLPARVQVKAQERQPVISWIQDGREQWIDMDGNAFPPRGDAGKLIRVEAMSNPPVIVKTSPMDLSFLQPEMVGVILRMAMKAPKNTPLIFDSKHGLGWKDAFNCQVYFGPDLSDMDQKLLVYQALAARLQKDGIQPDLISVEYLRAPYYRVEQ